jgi:glycosyltransferase involved in cell wall biosynthesis
MRLGVNARLLQKGKLEGIGYFAKQTLSRIVKEHPEEEFVFFFDRKYSQEFIFAKNVKAVIIPLPTRHPVLWWIYFEILLPIYLKIYKIDILFSPDGWMPSNPKIPTINTIHDINFFHNRSFIKSRIMQKYYMHFFPVFASNCTRLISVSQFSSRDIINSFSINEDKVAVIYNAASEAYHPLNEEEKQKIREKYTDGRQFFYFVGSLHKRKNLAGLFKAFDMFKQRTLSDVKLVIIGKKMWQDSEIDTAYNEMRFKNDVIFTGRLEAESITLFAAASLALVFVSYFEGFGIPVVEAFAARTAVITSCTTSMPEIADDAALYCEPDNISQIAAAIETIYSQPDVRTALIEKGSIRNQAFNWEISATKLWENILIAAKK